MAHLLYEALEGVNFDGQAVQFLLDSQGLSDDFASSADTEPHQTTTVPEDDDDLFQCGRCKLQFTSFQLFVSHKKEHGTGSVSKLDNHDLLLSLHENKEDPCSTNDQRSSIETAYNQLTVDTLTTDTSAMENSVIFSENDILSFAVDSSSLNLSPSLQATSSFPCVLQPEEFLSPTTVETTIGDCSIHKGKNIDCNSYGCARLDNEPATICTPELTENSTGSLLSSIHSITNRTNAKNIEARVDLCSIDDVNFAVPTSEETQDQCHMIFPEMNCASAAGKQMTEQIVDYEEVPMDNAATVLLNYSNNQTMKTCNASELKNFGENEVPGTAFFTDNLAFLTHEIPTAKKPIDVLKETAEKNLLPRVEFHAVQSTRGKGIACKVENENPPDHENVTEYTGSCAQTNAKRTETENNMKNMQYVYVEIKKTKTKRKTVESSETDKDKTENLIKDHIPVKLDTKGQNEQISRSMLKCSYCTKLFTKNFDLQQHIRSHTGEKPFQCVVCGRAFSQKSNAKKHMKSHKVWPKDQTSLPKRAIQLLGKENDGDSSQDNEDNETAVGKLVIDCPTLQRSYACQFCDTTFSVYIELKSHMKKHSDQKVYKCIQKRCLQTFMDLESFLEHTNCHIEGLQYRCHVCNKRFESLEALGVHQYSHGSHPKSGSKTLARGLVCCKCKRKFTSHAALEHHLDTSTHNFPCPFCGKVFTWERYLRRHLTIHGPEKSFSCTECGKSFRAEMYLKAHMLIHSDARPFGCQQCGATFNRKDKLVRHLLIHQSVKKFKCPFHTYLGCSREFSRQDKLKCHILTHTLTKPIRCKRCNKTFHRPAHLREHERLHCHKAVERKCSDCGIVFRSKVQLSSHMCNNETDPATMREADDVQKHHEPVLIVQKASRSKRKRIKKGSKADINKASNLHHGIVHENKEDNISTIEIIVVPVSVNNTETVENNSKDKSLYVTYPSKPNCIISSALANSSDSFIESQYTNIILPTNQQYNENIPELTIGNNCDNFANQ